MIHTEVFINRRTGRDRRLEYDPCWDIEQDLFHHMRRESMERRSLGRTLEEDYYAFLESREKPPLELDFSMEIILDSDDRLRR